MTKKGHKTVQMGIALFLVVLTLAIVAGYIVGKEMALRDNAADIQEAQ